MLNLTNGENAMGLIKLIVIFTVLITAGCGSDSPVKHPDAGVCAIEGFTEGAEGEASDWLRLYEELPPGTSPKDFDFYWCGYVLKARGSDVISERSNAYDPKGGGITDFNALLVGTWSRADAESNQVYTFKEDGRVELRDYTSPDGGTIDRNASYPQTLVLSFTGTYILVGDILRINFTAVQTNNPAGQTPSVRDKQVNIRISGNTLTMEERDGDRLYTRI
jgi:hypothetical protein